MPSLPNLIFTENHYDPTTSRVLSHIVLKLKQRGYQCFLDEMPTKTTLDSHLQLIEQGEKLFSKVAIKLKAEQGIDINDPNCLSQPFFTTDQGAKLVSFIKAHPSRMHIKPLLKSLKTNRMDYVAIDPEGSDTARDQYMADKFLKQQTPFFSRVGRGHARKIQEIILSEHSLKTATNQFCFVDIFSDLSGMTQLKNSDLPMGVLSINVSHLSDDEVVDKIIQHIVAKQSKQNVTAPKVITNQSELVSSTLVPTFLVDQKNIDMKSTRKKASKFIVKKSDSVDQKEMHRLAVERDVSEKASYQSTSTNTENLVRDAMQRAPTLVAKQNNFFKQTTAQNFVTNRSDSVRTNNCTH